MTAKATMSAFNWLDRFRRGSLRYNSFAFVLLAYVTLNLGLFNVTSGRLLLRLRSLEWSDRGLVYMAVIIPPHFPPASKPLATMTDRDWWNIATFHGSKRAIDGSVDIWDFRRSELCGGSAVQAGDQHEVEAGAY